MRRVADAFATNLPVDLRSVVEDYVQTRVCDVDGRFTFDGVAAGAYLAGTIVTWEVQDSTQGGAVFVPVTAVSGDVSTVAVTRVWPPLGVR